jgi:CheY-like chemotaxis protein
MLADGLPAFGFEVWYAESGYEALDLYREHQDAIDLVLLDYDNTQSLAQLRRLDPAVRCCFTTGFLEHGGAEQLFAQGAIGILTKPYRLDGLAAALRLLTALPSRHAVPQP